MSTMPRRTPMSPQLDRRTLLIRSLQASGQILAAPVLAACGGGGRKNSGGVAGKGLGEVGLPLDWIKNIALTPGGPR